MNETGDRKTMQAMARAMARIVLASRSAEQRPSTVIAADSGVKSSRYVWTPLVILWRVFQIMVVVPSSVVGGLLLIYALNGHSPVVELVTGIHDWAETSVRPAPVGMVLTEKCVPKIRPEGRAVDGTAIKPVLCESLEAKLVPFDEYALDMSHGARIIYFFLLAMAFFLIVLAYPARRLIGLTEKPVSAYAPRPRTSQGIDSPSGN